MHITTFRFNIWGYLISTLIKRVKYIVSNTLRLFLQVPYIFGIIWTMPMLQWITYFQYKYLNTIVIDMVNEFFF